MRELRATAAAVVLLFVGVASIAVPVQGQCVSSVQLLSARGTTPRFLAGPTAWNGSILAVAGPELDREEFQVVLYDEHGNRLAPNEKIRSSGADLLDVLWNGSEFGIFSINEDGFLALSRVTTAGKIIDPRVVVVDHVPLQNDDTADVAWSSQLGQYVVAWTRTDVGQRTIHVTWLKRDGTVTREATIDDSRIDSFVRVAIVASGTIGVFYEDDATGDVRLVAINGDTIRKSVTAWSHGDDITLTTRDNDFVMVRPVTAGGQTVARWQIIDTSGQIVRRDSRLFIGTGADVEPVSLLAMPDEYALAYLEWPEGRGVGDPYYRLARFGLDEERISDTYFAAALGTRRRRERTDFDFDWTGSAYVSLASNENGDDDDTFLVRYCPLQATVSGPHFAHAGQPVTLTASAEGGVPDYTYSWTWDDFGAAQGNTLHLSFPTIGDHRVTLTVKDGAGTTTTESFAFSILAPKRRSVRK
jgi:hypothetical protein